MYDGHIVHLSTVLEGNREALVGVHPFSGVVQSDDAGRSWVQLSEPPVAPVTALAVTPSGDVLVIGGPAGLYRSDAGGQTWSQVLKEGTVLAAAVSEDGQTIAAVMANTDFYRSDDGGRSWPPP
ncbi:MAG: hypothetical protein M3N29_09445 [Chloroflexota bacterium]|nr:hypothetical protein [Chloroflexota bacterium]